MNRKIIRYSLLVLLVLIGLPTYLSNQKDPSQEVTASAFEASIVEPFKELESLEAFRIKNQDEEYIFTSNGETLVSKDLPQIKEEVLWDFIGQVVSLQALTLEKSPEHTSLKKMSTYTFSQDEHHDITLELYALTHSDSYIGVVTYRTGEKESEEVLRFPKLPLAVSDFSLLYLEAPLDLSLASLTEITYQDKLNSFKLNQESTLSSVEQSPFISGWFLHDVYQTEFSVEYKQMESFLTMLDRLHSKPLLNAGETQDKLLTLSFVDTAQKNVNLIFYPYEEETMAMYWQEKDAWYVIPEGIVRELSLEPQNLIDNFIALIPLDAVESVTIEGLANMTINHQVETNGEGESAEEQHVFSLDGHVVEEAAFRKVYQYLAALTYQEQLLDKTDIAEEATLTLTYHFISDGEQLSHVIRFYHLDDESYAVEKNGVLEFTASKAQIDDMLTELKAFN